MKTCATTCCLKIVLSASLVALLPFSRARGDEPGDGYRHIGKLDEIVDDMVAQGVTPWICICL